MTDEQKYLVLLKAMAELLEKNNTSISLANYQIHSLESKLAAAEKQIQELKKEVKNEQ